MTDPTNSDVTLVSRCISGLPRPLAAGEFADQLRRVGAAIDQLASEVRDTYSFDPRRIEELTEELSRRFPPPQ